MIKLTDLIKEISNPPDNLYKSQVLARSIHDNVKKLQKMGGRIGMSVKSNKKTTATIIYRTLIDPKTKKYLLGSFDDNPKALLTYFVATFNNNKNYWKVEIEPEEIKAFKKIGVDIHAGKYSDNELAQVFDTIFKNYK